MKTKLERVVAVEAKAVFIQIAVTPAQQSSSLRMILGANA
jgi:hypothetical protein